MGEKNKYRRIWLPGIVFCCILALWEMGVRLSYTPLYVLPSPSKIATAFFSDFAQLSYHAGITLVETMLGIVIAAVLGIIIAVVMDASEILKNAVYPILVVTQTVPVIVLAPIFIIYLGFGIAPKVLIVVLMCFFPIVVSFAGGMANTDERQVMLARAFGAGPVKVYTMVKMPSAAVSLFSGLKVAATYSVTGAVVGEWLSASSGLGYYMIRVKNGYMLDKVFASVLMVVILSLLMNGLVRLIQYLLFPHLRKES